MKKLKITQPYASMIVAGVLKEIKNIWDNTSIGERIYIYAEDIDREFNEGLNYENPFHRYVYNQMFLGNIPDKIFPCKKYIGWVEVKGINYEANELSVSSPRIFIKPCIYFNTSETELAGLKAVSKDIKYISREGNNLYVPIGKEIKLLLRDPRKWKEINMFWEPYMSQYLQDFWSLFTTDHEDFEDIERVYFLYNSVPYGFDLEDGAYCDILPELSKEGNNIVSYLHLDIYAKIKDTSIPKIDHSKTRTIFRPIKIFSDLEPIPKQTRAKSLQDYGKQSYPEYREEGKSFHPFIKIIYTPMGGSTKWKRK